ncbi:hypothetical protein QO010_003685 [Caulobacter ginsengisoli]|uniref:Uncharacterized protein n=1 Tax=Caulobacter ginsengisoli TaxID=400775 RepID=A0ABU0IV45_9CAUL|nr:hypothetical protein [Caulobacter ginsengisoli]MDQ0465893.1 hypothetical protein [Caulobacter ginsengisoli]
MKFAAVLLALTLLSGPALATPAKITIQTRPDQVGDRYSYTVEHLNRDAAGQETAERQNFSVEVLEIRTNGLKIITTRQGGALTPNEPGGVDAMWDRAWFDIPVEAVTSRQGTPIQVLNADKAEPLITAKLRKWLAMPDNAVFNSVQMRFETESPVLVAARWAAPDLARIALLQHRGAVALGSETEPASDVGGGVRLTRTTTFSDYDPATCQVRVVHQLDYVNVDSGRHKIVRTESLLSTKDGWTIRFEGLETLPDGSTKTARIARVGPPPGC